jgi:hypothetical protein
MPIAALAAHWYTIGAAAIALFGVAITLAINGARAERQRRRDLHARALAAMIVYGEMPYRIRRRAPGAENRARLSHELSHSKAELDTCQVLLAADGDERLSNSFDDLYHLARTTVGKAAHDAWNAPPIEADSEMNQGQLYRQLAEFNGAKDQFADELRIATLPRRKRSTRWLRSTWPLSKLPFVHPPRAASERRGIAPQDLATEMRESHQPVSRSGPRGDPDAAPCGNLLETSARTKRPPNRCT